MLTGDHRLTAESVGKKLGIDEVEAGVEPQGKGERVKRLREAGGIVAMAGASSQRARQNPTKAKLLKIF
jgi:Cu+-exporting ATPase